jgi:hypothetical protein
MTYHPPIKYRLAMERRLKNLDAIMQFIPDHRGAPRRPVRDRTSLDRTRDEYAYDHGRHIADNHPPVGGVKSLGEYQKLLDADNERKRLDQDRKPAMGNAADGIRDTARDPRFKTI